MTALMQSRTLSTCGAQSLKGSSERASVLRQMPSTNATTLSEKKRAKCEFSFTEEPVHEKRFRLEKEPARVPVRMQELSAKQQTNARVRIDKKGVSGPYMCHDCGKILKRSSSLSNHRLIHKNVKAFKCEKCNASFLRKSDLGKHYAIHTGSKPYVCSICSKSFSQSSNMLTHKRRHSGVKPYKCGYCMKSFYRKVDVKRHEIVHTTSESE